MRAMRFLSLIVILLSGCGDAASSTDKDVTELAVPCDTIQCGSAEGECIASELQAVSLEAGCYLPGHSRGCWMAQTCEVGDLYIEDGSEAFRLLGCTNIELPARFVSIDEPLQAPDTPCSEVLAELDPKCGQYTPEVCPVDELCAVQPDKQLVDEPGTDCQVLEHVNSCLGFLPGVDFVRSVNLVSSLRVCPAE